MTRRTGARQARRQVGAVRWALGGACAAALSLASVAAVAQDQAPDAGPETPPAAGPLREGDPVIDLDRARRDDRGDPIDVAPTTEGAGAVVRGLDKFTGERATLDIPVDGQARFERMRVEVRSCLSRISALNSEASAFLQIFDEKEDPPLRVFSGWMFSSAPALSALDHPRFDFWVLRCST